jgi:hypothetical protein
MRKNPCTRHKFNSSGMYCLWCHAGRNKLGLTQYPKYSTVPDGYYTKVIEDIIDAVKYFESLQKPRNPNVSMCQGENIYENAITNSMCIKF